MVKCAELRDADLFFDNPAGILEVVTDILCAVGIRAEGEEGAAKVFIELENLPAGLGILEAIVPGRRVDLNAFAIRNGLFQNGCNEILFFFKWPGTCWIIAGQQVQMRQNTVMPEVLLHMQNLLIIVIIVFLLALSLEVVTIPEFFVMNLVHGEQHKVQIILILCIQLFIITNRMGLYAKLQTGFDGDLFRILFLQGMQLLKIAGLIHIGKRILFV